MNIIKDNNNYYIHDNVEILNKLQPSVYELDFDNKSRECYLKRNSDLSLPKKIYPLDEELIEISTDDFISNNSNLGILLIGNKGQGKSVTAKRIIKKINIPVITINKSLPDDINFISYLSTIKQDFILFIDEFEKIFPINLHVNKDIHTQESFLSFMDGTNKIDNKILFLLCSNDKINDYLINRPSRIKYLKEYFELDQKVFDHITDDLLNNKDYYDDLKKNVSMLNLNVDTLIEIIKLSNKLNKPYSDFKDIFNYKFPNIVYDLYEVDQNFNRIKHLNTATYKSRPDFNKEYSDYIMDYQIKRIIKYTEKGMILDAKQIDKETDEYTVPILLELAKQNY